MSSINSIFPDKVLRRLGMPHGRQIVEMCMRGQFESDPRFAPGAPRCDGADVVIRPCGFSSAPLFVSDVRAFSGRTEASGQ